MDKINNIGLSRLLTSVYDFDGFTEQEVWCRIAQKINIIIEHFNYLDKKIENEKENNKAKFDYLLGEGLSEQVAKYLLEKISDGTLGKLINETLLKDINDKVDEVEAELLSTLTDEVGRLDKDIEKVSGEFETSIQYTKDEIIKIYNDGLRKCKATFGFSAIGSACSDCTTLDDETEMLNKFKEIGITSFICCMYVNEAEGSFEIEDDLSLLTGTINFCKENGLSIPCIKLHFKNINAIDGTFYSKLENLLLRLHNIFKVVNYETFFLWNERTDDLSNNYLTTALTSASIFCTNILNVKPAIALQGYTPIGKIINNKSLINSLKVIGINHYPHISAKGEETVISDSINGWKDSYITENIKFIKNLNPNLDVYISESGLIASWRALCDPGYWSYDWQTYDNNTGKVCEIFYTGMLETLKNEDIPYIFGWFPHDFVKNTEVMKKMYDKYFNGGR